MRICFCCCCHNHLYLYFVTWSLAFFSSIKNSHYDIYQHKNDIFRMISKGGFSDVNIYWRIIIKLISMCNYVNDWMISLYESITPINERGKRISDLSLSTLILSILSILSMIWCQFIIKLIFVRLFVPDHFVPFRWLFVDIILSQRTRYLLIIICFILHTIFIFLCFSEMFFGFKLFPIKG